MTRFKPSEATTRRTPRTLARLIQAAVLALVLVPLGSVALEAEIISTQSCTFYYFGEFGEDSCGGSLSNTERTFYFDFGKLTLELLGMGSDGSTDITITEASLTQAEFDALNGTGADADCITIAGGDDGDCRMLEITASNPDAFSGWIQTTFWNFDTNLLYPNGDDPEGAEPGLLRVYRSHGTLTTEGELAGMFTEDMCLEAAAESPGFTPCEYFPEPVPNDPGIRSGDTDFSVITYSRVNAVPEPSSMLLLGAGLAGVAVRGRRRARV